MVKLILASASPRRRELIQLLEMPYTVQAAAVDEDSVTHPEPAVNALERAQLKATAVAAQLSPRYEAHQGEGVVIVAADTIVALERQMLGKPADEADARRILRQLRGRMHQVHTGIAVIHLPTGQMVSNTTSSGVLMRPYHDQEIETYIATGDPMDKAGSYAIQHPEFQPVAQLDGCYANVMGLPLCSLGEALLQVGVTVPVDAAAVCQTFHHWYHRTADDIR